MPAGIIIITTTITTMGDQDDTIGTPPPLLLGPLLGPGLQGDGQSPQHHRHTALLRLLAWLSPAFPTGGYAYSHGLEWAVETRDVTDATTLHAWLTGVLLHGAGRSDCILLRHAHRAAADPCALADIAELAAATAPSRERRAEALDQGQAFLIAAAAWLSIPLPGRVTYAVAVGAVAGASNIDRGRHGTGLSARLHQQPDLRRRPPGSARPDRGIARARRDGNHHHACRGGNS